LDSDDEEKDTQQVTKMTKRVDDDEVDAAGCSEL
jgi:hypothetical protein